MLENIKQNKNVVAVVDGLKVDRKAQMVTGVGVLTVVGGAVMGFKSIMLVGAGGFLAGLFLGREAGLPKPVVVQQVDVLPQPQS